MPELPEVESLRLSLGPFLLGKTITNIVVNNPKLISGKGTKRRASFDHQYFISSLQNETFQEIYRRGKNLVFRFASGKMLLVHLKMTGQLVFQDQKKSISGGHPLHNLTLPNQHTHLVFSLNQGTLYYNDLRQFGYLLYFPNQNEFNKAKHFQHLGPEPFSSDFTLNYFQQSLAKTKQKIKTLLLTQRVLAGLGNIYADEVCFASGVHPGRQANSLTALEIKKMHHAIRNILRQAISAGGTSVSDYLKADGSRGNYASKLKVYGRKNLPCLICQTALKSFKLNGRTTVYCPHCQK